MRQSPIYNIIDNPGRKSNCSFGARDSFKQDIRVGTSSENSHTLASIEVRRVLAENNTVGFNLYVDGVCVKKGLLDGKQFEIYA